MESYGKARKKAYVKSVLTISESKGFQPKKWKRKHHPRPTEEENHRTS